MEFVHVFVLTSLALDKKGDVQSRNVAARCLLFAAAVGEVQLFQPRSFCRFGAASRRA